MRENVVRRHATLSAKAVFCCTTNSLENNALQFLFDY
jgi:hypothetical protein